MAQDKSNLGYLGETFQYRLAHEFMANHTFFEDMSSILDQNMFTDPNLKTFVGLIKNFYEKFGYVPSYDAMDTELRNISHSQIEAETYIAILNKIKEIPDDGSDRIINLAEKFFRQQNIVKTAHEILKIASNGDMAQYDNCVSLLNEAMAKGIHDDLGEGLFSHIEETLSDDYRIPIPTGIGKIDEALEGGLGKGELGVIIGPTSFGKALCNKEVVLTPYGYETVEDIKEGDYLIGSNGKKTRVLGIFPQGERAIFRVTFSDGTYYDCDKEHILPVNALSQRSGKKYDKSLHKKVYKKDRTFVNMTLEEIMSVGLYRQGNRYNFACPTCEKVEFEGKELPIDPYLIGVMLGDGCLSCGNFSFSPKDEIIAENVKAILPKDFKYTITKNKRNLMYFNFNKMAKERIYEAVERNLRADTKYIPSDYLNARVEARIALLQGLMDTDGYVSKNGFCEYSTKSSRLANDFAYLVRSLGGVATVRVKQSSYFDKNKNVHIDCGIHYEISFGFTDESIKVCRLPRKQDRVRYHSKERFQKFIKSVDYVGKENATCFLVDADDHLFLTRSFNVTHNTSLTTAMASHAACSGKKVLQIVFEDRIKQIQRKHLGRISGIEAKDLSKPENIELVKKAIEEFPQREELEKNLRIVRFPSGEKTAKDIERFIKKLMNSGFKPDLVIIDYFECLQHEADRGSTNDFEKEGRTMRKFEAMAGELNIAIWIPSQGTKDSINLELVTMDKIGGSVKKAQIAHVIMSIARSVDDISNNKATIAILKNRAGKSGKVFNNVEFNNGTCRISTDNVDEFDDMLALKKEKEKERVNIQNSIFKLIDKEKEKN